MRVRAIDLETTGVPSDDDAHAIVQTGWCDLDDDVITGPFGSLVNPGRRIPVEAMAVHHIRDVDLFDAMTPTQACSDLSANPPDYYCAHNVDFEKKFFGGGDVPWLCTYKCALRLWTEAPGHKLQELRYFLGIDEDDDFDPKLAAQPHRAPDDAYVTAFVARRMLAVPDVDVAALVRWSKGPALLYMCFMKKHSGTPWSQVPKDYLRWILEKSEVKDRDIRATAKFYLNR